jgi:hypothetical protein
LPTKPMTSEYLTCTLDIMQVTKLPKTKQSHVMMPIPGDTMSDTNGVTITHPQPQAHLLQWPISLFL